ncbi:hypothetical protein [Ornithinibacillus sp. JPR2-1]|uniref:hypothetical protein n=1 Tax=Ornithinibacillus sp. JPR2-1 TaxID=2094019 RepID=UPI0031DC7D33
MITTPAADEYIEAHIIDIEDWQESDDSKKQRILNAAETTLKRRFKRYTIPDSAVYYFAAWLAIVFNDTNRYQQQGVAGYAITGVASFTFKENNVKSSGTPLASLIPDEVFELIGEENGIDLRRRRIGRSVR